MSNSYDNYIGLAMEPGEMFGRTMSIPDTLLEEWIRLASSASETELEERLAQAESDPLAAKRWLAADIVEQYHGADAARAGREAFDRVHREGGVPEDVPSRTLAADPETGTLWIGYALRDTGLCRSTSEAVRVLEQGGVEVDGRPVTDRDRQLEPGKYLIRKGKRSFVELQVAGRGR
jgi:tyrosyl-tRNA synthetase